MSSSTEILKKIHKDHGPSIAKLGSASMVDTPRLPTGIFPFDLASGGGFPMGRVSLIYGPESSNKTNMVLCALAQGQQIYPEKKAVFIDLENAYDGEWATKLGVDQDKIIVISPEYAEQAADFIDSFVYAEDVFAIAVDSIAALSTQNEMESSAEKVIVGGSALLTNKIFKKLPSVYNKMRNASIMPPALLAINQIRFKIGVMFGNPETLPGGNAQKYASSFTVRVYGKNIIDKKINAVMPSQKEVNLVIQKWKVPILSTNAVYNMQMLQHGGHGPGWCDDKNTLFAYLKELDYLNKGDKGGWVLFGDTFQTLDACAAHLYGDSDLLREAKATIIKEMLDRGSEAPEMTGEVDVEDAE